MGIDFATTRGMALRTSFVSMTCLILIGAAGAHAQTIGVATAGDQFASEITAAANKGWHLRDLQLNYRTEHGRTVHVVMANNSRAKRYSLSFDPEMSQVVHYESASVPLPKHHRYYDNEKQLLAMLAKGGPTAWNDECGEISLGHGSNTASIDPQAYFVAEVGLWGTKAQRALAKTMDTWLKAGAELVSMTKATTTPTGVARGIDITLVNQSSLTLHVGLDKANRVVFLQRRTSPSASQYQTYKHKQTLAKLVAGAERIRHLRLRTTANSQNSLLLSTGTGKRMVVNMRHFQYAHTGCGC